MQIIFLFTILLFVASSPAYSDSTLEQATDNKDHLLVYKSPTCGCCSNWIAHMEASGFTVEAVNSVNMGAIKQQYNIGANLQSCHTAVHASSGYVFEGHVPAGAVKQFLSKAPGNAIGLTVPGMPAGSPGMEMGSRFDPYLVIQLNEEQSPSLYMRVNSKSAQDAIGMDDQ
ncbi:MAG: DUF411 domain-containing protein [Pseudomonadales bacterium]